MAEATPPVARLIEKGVKTSAGTDATRAASYNPWVALAWLVTGRTVGGTQIYPRRNCLDRETALRMWSEYVSWFSDEEGKKGCIAVGQLGDVIVPSEDYLQCAGSVIAGITSDLTIVGGHVVYGAGDFASLDTDPPPPAMPDWSPVNTFGGYGAWADTRPLTASRMAATGCGCASPCALHRHDHARGPSASVPVADLEAFWGALGCACWTV